MKKLFVMILLISAPAYATMMTRSQQRALGILHRELAAITTQIFNKPTQERMQLLKELEDEDRYITELVERSTAFIIRFPGYQSAQSLRYIRNPMQTILSQISQ